MQNIYNLGIKTVINIVCREGRGQDATRQRTILSNIQRELSYDAPDLAADLRTQAAIRFETGHLDDCTSCVDLAVERATAVSSR